MRQEPEKPEANVQAMVLAEQVRALYQKAPLAYTTIPVNTAIVAYVLGPVVQARALFIWLAVVVLLTAVRARVVIAYRREQPTSDDAARWARYFVIGSDLNAALWATGAILFFVPDNVLYQVFLVFVIGGMAAGAVTSLSSYPRALYSYVGVTVFALSVRLLLAGDRVHIAMGAMLALFGGALAMIGRSSGRSFSEATALRCQNAGLVERLSAAHRTLAETNKELESRVRSRSAELERFRGVLDHAEECIILASTSELRIIDANAEATALLGISQPLSDHSLIDTKILDQDMSSGQWRTLIESLRASGSKRLDIVRHTAGATKKQLEVTTSVCNFENEEFLLFVIRDVTEQKALETELVKSDLLASIGRLAGGVGHEINNPLSYVISNLDFVKTVLEEHRAHLGPAYVEVHDALVDSEHGAHTIQDIVRSLATLASTKESSGLVAVSIHSVLNSCIRVVANEVRQSAKLIRSYSDKESMVRGSVARLSQVFLHLLTNASQSFLEGYPADNQIEIVTGQDLDLAWVEIRDTGPGIDESKLDHIFEPFFSTRGGVGDGLGLFVTRTIVRNLDGTVVATNRPDGGACFRVTLPLAEQEDSKEDTKTQKLGKVLVIDDQPLVGKSLQRALIPHIVSVVTSGEQGVKRLAKEHFDLVLCDLMMPGMSGVEVYEHLKKNAPADAKRIVFLTGATSAAVRLFLESVSNLTLKKPYDTAMLFDLIEERVDRAREP